MSSAMGERLTRATFRDRIEVRRAGRALYLDGVAMDGDINALLQAPATGAGHAAMASLLYVAPDAQAHLADLQSSSPATGGTSLLAPDVLAFRLVALDGHALRQHLLPVLDRLSGGSLPVSWRL